MEITPLYRHAAMRLPAVTGRFSTPLAVTSLAVVKDGLTTVNCTAAHGVTVGASIAIAITDAPYGNPIESATRESNGDWTIETTNDHNLTRTPDPDIAASWDLVARLSGFADSAMNGTLQLVSVSDRFTFTVRPGSSPASITLTGDEIQLANLDFEMVGWHKVTATTATALTFPTPANVLRDYTVDSPTVVKGIRVFGAVDLDTVMMKYVRDDAETVANEITMFLIPQDRTRVRPFSRGNFTGIGPSQAAHYTVEDGFQVIVLIPSGTSAGVTALDLAQGEILRAIIRTFNGLKIQRAGIPNGKVYDAQLVELGAVPHDWKTYVHSYSFAAHVDMSSDDRIRPHEIADIESAIVGSTSVSPVGAPPYREIEFGGLTHSGEPGILTATVQLDVESS